jgi:hypothetical protein
MTLMVGQNGRAWLGLPDKPRLDADEWHMRDDRGKPVYSPVLAWRDRELADAFSKPHRVDPGRASGGLR